MKVFCTLIGLCIISCNAGVSDKSQTDSAADKMIPADSQPSRVCYQRVEGISNQDTTTLSLVINGTTVTGELNHIPAEKDSRKGEISGNLKGNIISGMWRYIQEGIQDTLRLEFKLEDERLLQKNYSVDSRTGRQILTDSSEFELVYSRINCRN